MVEAYSEVARRLGIMPESVQGENKGPVLVKMKARVFVTLKNGVLDPQGKAIGHALNGLGFGVGRRSAPGQGDRPRTAPRATPPRPRPSLKEMCEKLLANTVIEKYEIEIR